MTRFSTSKENGTELLHDHAHSRGFRYLDQYKSHNDHRRIQSDKVSGAKRRVLNRTRALRSLSDAKESSQSDIPYPASTISWTHQRGHAQRRRMEGKLHQGSSTDLSSDSEYRGPEERVIASQLSPAPRCTTAAPPTIQQARQRKSIWTKPIMWVFRMFLWLAFLVTVQIVVMGLLFR